MKTKGIQLFWVILATVFVAGMVYFVKDTLTITAISGTFTGVIGVFLGVDILTMIHKTKGLPPGYYKEMNRHRYITALCAFALLLAEAFTVSALYERDLDSLYLSFGVGFVVVIGGLIGGIEGNKIVTGVKEGDGE
jgi:hypothetical protein